MRNAGFTQDCSREIWQAKYRFGAESGIQDSWRRVAGAIAAVEAHHQDEWRKRFYHLLDDFRFLPGGRIMAGAGTDRRVTLFNCFVMGIIEDSLDGIFTALREGALTMQQGGGVGYDFSTLRPSGMPAHAAGTIASGPVSFMRIWDSVCDTLLSTGARRGAMMATLRCDHPDIEAFIDAKRDAKWLRNFNLSVLITDDFLAAVKADEEWPLVFPLASAAGGNDGISERVMRAWSGQPQPVPCKVIRKVSARQLWGRLVRAAYDYAEPGVLFIDQINRENNLAYHETISATNPCGEIPLPAYGACNLGSFNLTRFVRQPFTPEADLDWESLMSLVPDAVRFLDNVIDASRFPLPQQAEQAQGTRRIGIGITGLADTLIMLNLRYDEPAARSLAERVIKTICHTAYRASVMLAREKNPFAFFEEKNYLDSAFIRRLPEDIRADIAQYGIRNSHLVAIAPTGTISLLANNISSGIEPVFDFNIRRRVRLADGGFKEYHLDNHARLLWRSLRHDQPLPETFLNAGDIAPEAHLQMQASLQRYVDNAISKTINIPRAYSFEAFKNVYEKAHELYLKGCSAFRPNPVTGELLVSEEAQAVRHHCCDMSREPD